MFLLHLPLSAVCCNLPNYENMNANRQTLYRKNAMIFMFADSKDTDFLGAQDIEFFLII